MECFRQLRTLKGLGYSVYCHSLSRKDSGDFSVTVQSVKFHPNYVIDTIHDFLKNMYHHISTKMSQSLFMSARLALSSLTLPERMSSRTFWESVQIKDFKSDYSRLEDVFKVAGEMNFDKYKELFYKYFINESTRRMLTIVVYGKGKVTKLNVDCNISSYRIDQTKLDLHHACI